MDDQASKLRRLVRHFRRASAVQSGPPLIAVYSPFDDVVSGQLVTTLPQQFESRGANCRPLTQQGELQHADSSLTRLTGPFRTEDVQLWQSASALIVVVYSDDESIVEAYTQLKQAYDHTPLPALELVVVGDESDEARAAADRLAQTCERFLHCRVGGVTILRENECLHVEPMVDRLLAMAPVAANAHSSLAPPSELTL